MKYGTGTKSVYVNSDLMTFELAARGLRNFYSACCYIEVDVYGKYFQNQSRGSGGVETECPSFGLSEHKLQLPTCIVSIEISGIFSSSDSGLLVYKVNHNPW